MIEDPYRDADLVELYDLDNPSGEDHSYYRALADEIGAEVVIDLGCGTGLLTRSQASPDGPSSESTRVAPCWTTPGASPVPNW